MSEPNLPTPPSSDDDILAAYYHEQYPGLKREFFDFLKNVSQMEKEILPVARIIMEHQSQFESKTVVYTRQELFTHLCSRGYTTELATFLTEDADEDIIPHWTLSQWTVAFLSYATKTWASVVECGQAESSNETNQTQSQETPSSTHIRSESKEYVNLSDLTVQLTNFKKESPHLVLFHFTTKLSAASIQRGIALWRSNRNSEFAVAGTFYMTGSIDFGLKWLRTRHRSRQCAVLIFEVPDSFFHQRRCGHLEFPNDDWKKFCYYNFNEDPERLQQQQIEIENDIIVGPICKFRATPPSHPDHTTLLPFLDGNQNVCMQYAILNQSTANDLMNYLSKTWDIDI